MIVFEISKKNYKKDYKKQLQKTTTKTTTKKTSTNQYTWVRVKYWTIGMNIPKLV